MRIAFGDFSERDYNVESVYQIPLGGSKSALCYLAEALAQQGHRVFLFNHTASPGTFRGVECLNLSALSQELLQTFDVFIVQNSASPGKHLREIMGSQTRLVLWTQHAHDQPAMEALHNSTDRDVYDEIVLISEWQRHCYQTYFGIAPDKTHVLRNAISPSFAAMFPEDIPILPQKSQPSVLAYCSTPYRGLELLLDVFPQIRQAVPGTQLKVFSSMKVYQVDRAEDELKYGQLYQRCQEMEGVEYIGSLSQSELARELKSISILAYPNTFPETSCIAAMEAMASGCYIVTSDLGALPETTAEFARLIPIKDSWEDYKHEFIEQTVSVLQELTNSNDDRAEAHLRAQVNYINRCCTWSIRAQEWVQWLKGLINTPSWQASRCLVRGEYDQASTLYEEAIELSPTERSNYWYLGLVLLLQEQETEAQTIWLSVLIDAQPDCVEVWTAELVRVLQTEAQRQEISNNFQMAWVIRQHIREFVPGNCNNLIALMQLSAQLNMGSEIDIILSDFIEILTDREILEIDQILLKNTLQGILEFAPNLESVINFFKVLLEQDSLVSQLKQPFLDSAATLLQQDTLPRSVLIEYAKLYLQLQPDNIPVLVKLINLYQDTRQYDESLKFAEEFLNRVETLPDRIAALYLISKGLMSAGGNFDRAKQVHQDYEKLVLDLVESNAEIDRNHLTQLITTSSFLSYLSDTPQITQRFRSKLGNFIQEKIKNHFQEQGCQFIHSIAKNRQNPKKLKIGYLSSCFRRNSVGYLVRWLLQHHDRDRFQIYAYSLQRTDDEVQQFIASQVSIFTDILQNTSISDIAQKIYRDEIDILVDLDSLTSSICCTIMALKPAPIQVTWLGFDASEISTIDYFLADPYVLPESAQNYYTEEIWRLPQTYIAIDGFEVGVPTLRREDLDIPPDAVIYFSSQTGAKRHPDNARLQLKILRNVPNSYFLVKGLYTDRTSIQNFFEQIAKEEGVEFDRLRFLPDVSSEATHRANLSIADVVLDTYPYNGTTTTLETLWMEVPVVTRVGEQFSSRQGYTLLTNAGITEGIARTNEDYVEWGIRLGKDAKLRQQIAWKLRRAKQTAPLWNTKQFALDIETAYQQMWEQYLERT
jgi:predicted O-linked N-acetylglucosamine transferase (SPINDLY family)/glycosyltransferase involved in cell wall biosynthesis